MSKHRIHSLYSYVHYILFSKTTIRIDVTFQSLETNNNIYGRVSNPFNTNLTSGGSSGGESALIASHGSPMGIGTDIGGSIVSIVLTCER